MNSARPSVSGYDLSGTSRFIDFQSILGPVMKLTAILSVLATLLGFFSIQAPSSVRVKPSKPNPSLLVTTCGGDGFAAVIPDFPARNIIARVADLDLEAGF